MLRLTLITIAACFIFFTPALSQRFLPASLTLASGDTLNGYIKLSGSDKSPQSILFSLHDSKNFLSYGADMIKSVKTVGEIPAVYESFNIQYDVSLQVLPLLKNDPDPLWKTGSYLLKLLVAGELNLYKFTDRNDRVHFFLSKKAGTPEELINRKYLKEDVVFTNDIYKQQLSDAVISCSVSTGSSPFDVEYNEKELIAIVYAYNNCKSGNTFITKTEKAKIKFSLKAGINHTSLSLGKKELFVREVSSSVRPSFAIGANIIFPGNAKQSSLLVELASKIHENAGSNVIIRSPDDYTEYNEVYKATYIKLNLMYRRSFTKSNISPFIQAGICLGHASNLSGVRKTKTVFYSSEGNTIENIKGTERKMESGVIGGIGIPFMKHSAIELRYEISNGLSNKKASNSEGNAITANTLFVYYSFSF
jgi:hypothetical protein